MTPSTGVAITNPLVLYRSWVATNRIRADPAQHRLAIHLQKLYERLKDYSPAEEYSHKLSQLNRVLSQQFNASSPTPPFRGLRLWKSLLAGQERRETLAVTRYLTDHDAAMEIDSPHGLLLHGAVGTGKSMLIDLLAECLPTKRKRRYHYSTFMLNVLSRLEFLRRERLATAAGAAGSMVMAADAEQHSLLWLARELVLTSPILFLDEFQLPDRMAAKTMSGLLTAFFRLGGVLVATSNRLPDELAKAAGMDYAISGAPGSLLETWMKKGSGKNGGMFAGQGEFAGILELLKRRCDVWEMEGKSDYRRDGKEITQEVNEAAKNNGNVGTPLQAVSLIEGSEGNTLGVPELPARYLLASITTNQGDIRTDGGLEQDIVGILGSVLPRNTIATWTATTAIVYGRTLHIPRTCNGISAWTFDELCTTELGPADYITLASSFHTFIITGVPILTAALKNEARRFITLLDALYEARCKLAISAATAPDDLFFPDLRPREQQVGDTDILPRLDDDVMHAETFAEIHQDLANPFRLNISSYGEVLAEDALEDDPPNRIRRNALEGMSEQERMETLGRRSPNFSQSVAFVGEDEKFAYKRATSRLWELCGSKWWSRQQEGWWRPLSKESRHWERKAAESQSASAPSVNQVFKPLDAMGVARDISEKEDGVLFRHGASPFRTSTDPPPRIQPEHMWGMVQWGKKAGAWGKGVEGLKDKKKLK